MINYSLYGTKVKETYSSAGAIGASLKVGKRIVRPPLAVAKSMLKLTSGAVVNLTEDERVQAATLGIKLVKPTEDEEKAAHFKLTDQGIPAAEATIRLVGAVKSEEPISLGTYFAPAT